MIEKRFPGFVTQFYETIIDTNYANVLMLYTSLGSMKHWIPQNKETTVIKRETWNRGLAF